MTVINRPTAQTLTLQKLPKRGSSPNDDDDQENGDNEEENNTDNSGGDVKHNICHCSNSDGLIQ